MAIKGYASPEVEAAYTQAQMLCERVGDLAQQFVTLWGLWGLRLVHVDLKRTHAMSEQMLDIAQRLDHALSLQRAHFAMAMLAFIQGELKTAKTHIDRGLAIEETEHRHSYRDVQHPRVGCMTYHAFYLWMRGDSDRAAAQAEAALTLAREIQHPLSETFALVHAAVLYQFRRQWPHVLRLSEAAIQLASEQGFAYFTAAGTILRGWAIAASGDPATGLEQMQAGLQAYRATGAELHVPYLLTMVAEGHRQMHQPEAGRRVLAEALTRVRQTGECWWEAELYRLEGDALWQQSERHVALAEASLRRAVDLANQRGTKALELRASVSLGRLWQRQGQLQQARRLLGTLCQELTEGAETPDLQEAKQLYEACAAEKP
jgi:predicted ATPase